MKPFSELVSELAGTASTGIMGVLVKNGIDKAVAKKAAEAAAKELAKNKDFAENEAFRMRFGD